MAIVMNFLKTHIFLVLFFTLLVASGLLKNINQLPTIKISKQESALNFSHDFIRIFSTGQTRLVADLLWITTLLESDLDHYKNKDLNSWLFHRFNTITNIDPLFLRNYQFGGQYLSIIKDDLIGASNIFLKGLSYFENDYTLNFQIGYLYSFELFDYEKAYFYLDKVKNHPSAPRYIKSILNKLKFKSTGDLDLAYQLTKHTLSETTDQILIDKLKSDLYSLKATIDLDCLNIKKDSNCSKVDYDGNSYIFQNGKYSARKKFKEYNLYINKRP